MLLIALTILPSSISCTIDPKYKIPECVIIAGAVFLGYLVYHKYYANTTEPTSPHPHINIGMQSNTNPDDINSNILEPEPKQAPEPTIILPTSTSQNTQDESPTPTQTPQPIIPQTQNNSPKPKDLIPSTPILTSQDKPHEPDTSNKSHPQHIIIPTQKKPRKSMFLKEENIDILAGY